MIAPDALVRGLTSLSYPYIADDRVYWIEDARLMVAAVGGGSPGPVMPDGPAVRSELYGYGAMPYAVRHSVVFFVDAHDQALYRYDHGRVTPVSPPRDDEATVVRFGAPATTSDGRYVYCVRECDAGPTTTHDLVRIAADGSAEPHVVAEGHDFYGAPVLHPDDTALAFLTWDLPDMPWDASLLWSVSLTEDDESNAIRLVAGGPGESITQPAYGPDGRLYYVSDRTGWWNLYVHRSSEVDECLTPQHTEFGRPDWFCGQRTYGFAGDTGIVAVSCRTGRDRLVRIHDGSLDELAISFDAIEFVATSPGGELAVIGATQTRAPAVVRVSIRTGGTQVLRESWPDPPNRSLISRPEPLTVDSDTPVHALFYRPPREDRSGPPPLLVLCHGGPTVMVSTALDITTQLWTCRGFAVVAVNYRGSPGFGRAYRESIRGGWGVLDVADCLAVVRHLVAAGAADPARIVVRGRSSGGLTALRVAATAGRHGVRIAAVISVSGVTDPADLAGRTHKMESRYLDGLIGPWPEAKAEYEDRSVFADLATLTAPTLLVHGARDRVVPVAQARRLHQALTARGVRAEFVTFDEEGHAIRHPDHVRAMVRAELDFVAHVFGPRSATASASSNPQRSE